MRWLRGSIVGEAFAVAAGGAATSNHHHHHHHHDGGNSSNIATVVARRHVRQPPSPDRSYNETIQDAQNTFHWHDHHIFRPHQHFTYDPSSWSRTLTERGKGGRKLSLVERLEREAEHAAEAATNREKMAGLEEAFLTTMEESASFPLEPTGPTSTDAAEAAEDEDPWTRVPLQDLLDEVQRLKRRLSARRYSHNASLVLQERMRRDYEQVLLQLFRRVGEATVGETMTLDALIFSWFVLLHNAADLHHALLTKPNLLLRAADGKENTTDEEAAVESLYTALAGSLLPHLVADGAAFFLPEAAEDLTLEGMVEAAFVLHHPLTQRGVEAFSSPDGAVALREAATRVGSGLYQLLLQRLTEPAASTTTTTAADGASAGAEVDTARVREFLDPIHTRALGRTLRSLHRIVGDKAYTTMGPLLLRVLRGNVAYLEALLRASIGQDGRRHELRAALSHGRRTRLGAGLRDRGDGAGLAEEEEVEDGKEGGSRRTRASHPKPFALDSSQPPRGVVHPLTEADDVSCNLEAFTELLTVRNQVSAAASLDAPAALVDVLDAVQELLAYTPNYDLEPAAAVRFVNVAAASGVLWGGPSHREQFQQQARRHPASTSEGDGTVPAATEDAVRRALRFVLLLSRIDVAQAFPRSGDGQRAQQLSRLLLTLCSMPPPRVDPSSRDGANAAREWRRLRGVAVHHLLDTLHLDDLVAGEWATRAADGLPELAAWEQCLAYGTYDGLVPLALWRASCVRHFASRVDPLGLLLHQGGGGEAPRGAAVTESVSPRTAEALLRLRGRPYAQPRQSRQSPLSTISLTYVALCVEAASAGQLRASDLLRDAKLWEAAATFVDLQERDGQGVGLLLAEARSMVAQRAAAATKVTTFF